MTSLTRGPSASLPLTTPYSVSSTYDVEPRFQREFRRLRRGEQRRFLAAKDALVAGLRDGTIPPALRVKRAQRDRRAWELTWGPDGRATFEYGAEQTPGEPRIIWRRIEIPSHPR